MGAQAHIVWGIALHGRCIFCSDAGQTARVAGATVETDGRPSGCRVTEGDMRAHVFTRGRPIPAFQPATASTEAVQFGPALLMMGVVALWVALAAGLALGAEQLGMTAGEGWAFAIGMVSYIYLFVGLVAGITYVVRHEQE